MIVFAAGVLGGAGLLIVLAMLNTGRLHIEQVCDVRRDQNPAGFWMLLAALVLFSLLLILACLLSVVSVFSPAS
jgi:hypothetical protein